MCITSAPGKLGTKIELLAPPPLPALCTFGLLASAGFVLGFVAGILGVTATGIGINWNLDDVSGSFSSGANWAWYGNNYDWRPFLAAVLCSTIALWLWCLGALLLRKRFGVHGPGISGLMMRIPGAKYVTASPNWLPDSGIGAHDLPRIAGAAGGSKQQGPKEVLSPGAATGL